MLCLAPPRLLVNKAALNAVASPDTGAADTLYTFLTQRFVGSYQMLDCASLIDVPDPISVKTDAKGVAISATTSREVLSQDIQKLAPHKAEDDHEDSSARSRQSSL